MWPNILGNFQGYRRALTVDAAGGAFKFFGDNGYDWDPGTSLIDKQFGIEFKASNSSSLYVGSTLQTKAISVLPCIRC